MDFTYFSYVDYTLCFGVLGIVLMIIGVLSLFMSSKYTSDRWFEIGMIICIASFVSFTIGNICYIQSPQPIDVYKHNTELKVKYVGDKAVDSVVVFKKGEKTIRFEKKYNYDE